MPSPNAVVNDPLVVEGLVRSYGELIAVAGLDLSVGRGELLAMLGPNGAGKTTTMRMLAGLLKPDRGRITVMGEGRRRLLSVQRRFVGYCPQRLIVWRDLTCREQLVYFAEMYRLGRRAGERRASELLEMFGLLPKKDALAAHLSGGMQRRLSLALAMVHDPEILILDEPAAGLDPQSRVLVRQRVRSLCHEQQKTILISTHDMEEADRLADRVAIMDHGELLALDTPTALKHRHGARDLVEVVLGAQPHELCEQVRSSLAEQYGTAHLSDGVIHIDAENGADLLGPIKQQLAAFAVEASELRVRRRSLEDLFIELTGRRLRE